MNHFIPTVRLVCRQHCARRYIYSSTSSRNEAGSEMTSTDHKVRPYTEIPGRFPSHSIGRIRTFLAAKKNMPRAHEYFLELHQALGPLVRSEHFVRGLLVVDPDLVKELFRQEDKYPRSVEIRVWKQQRKDSREVPGLLSADSANWRKLRTATNKTLGTNGYVTATAACINDVTADFLPYLESMRNADCVINLNDYMFKWALESIGAVLFERRLECFSDLPSSDSESTQFMQAVKDILETTVRLYLLPNAKYSSMKVWQRLDAGFRTVFAVAHECVDQKVAELETLRSRHKGIDKEMSGLLTHIVFQGALSTKEIYGSVIELMMASVETVSNTTLMAVYELARNPDVQDKLLAEIERVALAGQAVTPQMFDKMPYLKGIVKESLRLYPVANTINRVLSKDIVISNYQIPSETFVSVPLYAMGRMESIYPDPTKFKPERWFKSNTNSQPYHPYAWIPFGTGVKSCIGQRIAEMEMYILLCQLVRQFTVSLSPRCQPLKLKTKLTLTPDFDISVVLHKRL